MRAFFALVCLLTVGAEDIDPQIYAKLFQNNQPLFTKMAESVVEYLQSNTTVLDIGSGPGEPTLTLAKMLPTVTYRDHNATRIVCTDVQAEMQEKAKSRVSAAGVKNVDFAVASADNLAAWKDGAFDAVMMNLVLMFVPDRAKGLKEATRVVKPDHYVFVSVWKKLPFYDVAHAAIEEVAGKKMRAFAINPLALAGENAVEDLAHAAGLKVIKTVDVEYSFAFGSSKEAADGMFILAGGMIKQMVADGDAGASDRFYKIADRMFIEKGWVKKDNAVTIPYNVPEIAILQKPLKHDEL